MSTTKSSGSNYKVANTTVEVKSFGELLELKSDVKLAKIGAVEYHRHTNGDGWVGPNAEVSKTAYIASKSLVLDYAIIEGEVIVSGMCVIGGYAKLKDKVIVSGAVKIYDDAELSESCAITGNSSIFGKAKISGSVMVKDNGQVGGDAVLEGRVLVENDASVLSGILKGSTIISGTAVIKVNVVLENVTLERGLWIAKIPSQKEIKNGDMEAELTAYEMLLRKDLENEDSIIGVGYIRDIDLRF